MFVDNLIFLITSSENILNAMLELLGALFTCISAVPLVLFVIDFLVSLPAQN